MQRVETGTAAAASGAGAGAGGVVATGTKGTGAMVITKSVLSRAGSANAAANERKLFVTCVAMLSRSQLTVVALLGHSYQRRQGW